MENLSERIYGIVSVYGPKLIGAIITLIIGMWLISVLTRALRKRFEKQNMEPSLRGFLNRPRQLL